MTFYEIRICKDDKWRKVLFIEDHKSDYLCKWYYGSNYRIFLHVKNLCPDVEIIDKPVEIDPTSIDIDLYVDHPEIIKLIHEGRREKEREARHIRQQEDQQINAQINRANEMGIVHPLEMGAVEINEQGGLIVGNYVRFNEVGFTTRITLNGNTFTVYGGN